jgi:hypothetical protein
VGKKRPSVRSLPSGEKVVHNPDGSQFLVPENKVTRFLEATHEATQEKVAALDTAMMEAIQAKRDSLDAGDAVPHDKRPI